MEHARFGVRYALDITSRHGKAVCEVLLYIILGAMLSGSQSGLFYSKLLKSKIIKCLLWAN